MIVEVLPEFYWRGQSGIFPRDLNANELTSLRLIMAERERLPVTLAGIRKRFANFTEGRFLIADGYHPAPCRTRG